MKKNTALVLTFVILFNFIGVFRINAVAYGRKECNGFYYKVLQNKYAVITGVTGTKEEEISVDDVLEFPEELEGYIVRYIGDDFAYSFDVPHMKKIIIPHTVTYIGEDAFNFGSGFFEYDTTSKVETVELPPNLSYIGEDAFRNSKKLKEIIIPDSVIHIGKNAFSYCNSLEEVHIPSTVRVMEKYAFAFCDNLKKVIIEEGIESISKGAFSHCNSLKSIDLPKSVRHIGEKAFFNCTKLKSVNIKDDVYLVGEKAFGYYENKNGKELPDEKFKLKIYEPKPRSYFNVPLHYAIRNNMKAVFYLNVNTQGACRINLSNSKIKLKINGEEVDNWVSAKPNIAKITDQGTLKTIEEGKTKLTAFLKDGSTYKRKIRVIK